MRGKRRGKYNSRRVKYFGHTFDSAKEGERYLKLRSLLAVGRIRNLELQPKFDVIVHGKFICYYKADFRYETAAGEVVIEDVKGMKTPVYKLKKKLVEAIYDIEIMEV